MASGFYDWDLAGRTLIRLYDVTLAPATQLLVKHVLRIGTIVYGGNFAVRRDALERIGGFDQRIEFHGEDTNLGRRLLADGGVALCYGCWLYTSAREITQNRLSGRKNSHVIALDIRRYISADQNWPAIKTALRRNVDVALALFRKGDWAV